MPVHDLGYRPWRGRLLGALGRTFAIAETGCRLALKSTWVKRALLLGWLPILMWGVGVYLTEQVLQVPRAGLITEAADRFEALRDEELFQEAAGEVRREMAQGLIQNLGFLPEVRVLANALGSKDPDEARKVVWRWLLMTYFRYPQSVAMVFLLGFVVPGLIARDIRSRAFYLYFCRPIGRLEYIVGKLAVPAIFLLFVSTLPSLALYVTGLFLSPDLRVLTVTWDVPLRVLLATLVLVLPTASLAIALSSLTQESRFASFAWFAVWLLGHGAWLAVLLSRAVSMSREPGEALRAGVMDGWSPLSLYMSLGEAQSWIFGFNDFRHVWPSVLMLAILTVASLGLFWFRISRNMRT